MQGRFAYPLPPARRYPATLPDFTTQLWRTNGSKTAALAAIDIGQTHLAAGQNLF